MALPQLDLILRVLGWCLHLVHGGEGLALAIGLDVHRLKGGEGEGGVHEAGEGGVAVNPASGQDPPGAGVVVLVALPPTPKNLFSLRK